MKTNKFFAAALAALALVGMTACDKEKEVTDFTLSESTLNLAEGQTKQLTATVAIDKWESSDTEVATVANGLVTAIKEGNAIISATANGVTKSCIVAVSKAGTNPGGGDNPGVGGSVKGSEIWPIILDGTTFDANASKVKADLRVDDTEKFLYVWENTYVAGEGTGKNFYGNTEGYVSLVCGTVGWSGCGFCLTTDAPAAKAEELRKAIVADPDNYFLHIAIKATTAGNHQIYTFNDAATSFAIGTATIEAGAVIGDFTRDGSWAEFDVPMSQFATALSSLTFPTKGNIFCVLSGNNPGSQLNLDAVYFYKK